MTEKVDKNVYDTSSGLLYFRVCNFDGDLFLMFTYIRGKAAHGFLAHAALSYNVCNSTNERIVLINQMLVYVSVSFCDSQIFLSSMKYGMHKWCKKVICTKEVIGCLVS